MQRNLGLCYALYNWSLALRWGRSQGGGLMVVKNVNSCIIGTWVLENLAAVKLAREAAASPGEWLCSSFLRTGLALSAHRAKEPSGHVFARVLVQVISC